MMLVALAIEHAARRGDAIRQGFYKIEGYDGLIKMHEAVLPLRITTPSTRTTTFGRSSSTTQMDSGRDVGNNACQCDPGIR